MESEKDMAVSSEQGEFARCKPDMELLEEVCSTFNAQFSIAKCLQTHILRLACARCACAFSYHYSLHYAR